mmetsp:Transcript_91452/g.238299  ORF Transcript_91452/g.238299 Transcript_91452/m.238299 type:complete len:276 (+) Transcript_91452:169-996(+)
MRETVRELPARAATTQTGSAKAAETTGKLPTPLTGRLRTRPCSEKPPAPLGAGHPSLLGDEVVPRATSLLHERDRDAPLRGVRLDLALLGLDLLVELVEPEPAARHGGDVHGNGLAVEAGVDEAGVGREGVAGHVHLHLGAVVGPGVLLQGQGLGLQVLLRRRGALRRSVLRRRRLRARRRAVVGRGRAVGAVQLLRGPPGDEAGACDDLRVGRDLIAPAVGEIVRVGALLGDVLVQGRRVFLHGAQPLAVFHLGHGRSRHSRSLGHPRPTARGR